jgi:hypothetical protein
MITEPPTDGQRNALQDIETLYIGVATPAVRRDLVGTDQAESRRQTKTSNQDVESRLCAIELS